jgi:hypothetical protein
MRGEHRSNPAGPMAAEAISLLPVTIDLTNSEVIQYKDENLFSRGARASAK